MINTVTLAMKVGGNKTEQLLFILLRTNFFLPQVEILVLRDGSRNVHV
jgi:hypothetical protein